MREGDELRARERAAGEASREGLAVDELHRQAEASGQLDDVVDAHDVGVGDLARRLQLAPEALQALGGGVVVLEELEGDHFVRRPSSSTSGSGLGSSSPSGGMVAG